MHMIKIKLLGNERMLWKLKIYCNCTNTKKKKKMLSASCLKIMQCKSTKGHVTLLEEK